MFLFAAGSGAMAYDGLDLYSARISAKDRVNSKGVALKTLSAILAQDRANYHRFGKRDPQDEKDFVFKTAEGRQLIPKAKIEIDPALKRRILGGGDVDISVFVFSKDSIEIQEGLLDPNVG